MGINAVHLNEPSEHERYRSMDLSLKNNGYYSADTETLLNTLWNSCYEAEKQKPENIIASTFVMPFYSYVASIINYCTSKGD